MRTTPVERGIALHKMIRLLTASTINGGYLNFMGNEFGTIRNGLIFRVRVTDGVTSMPGDSANLVDNKELCCRYLGDFDKAMLDIIGKEKNIRKSPVTEIWHNDGDQVLRPIAVITSYLSLTSAMPVRIRITASWCLKEPTT